MNNREDVRNDLQRLQRALEALATDLDATERRPHLLLRQAAATSEDNGSLGIESFVDHFAFAIERGNARLSRPLATGSACIGLAGPD
jgi:hypothetical protein